MFLRRPRWRRRRRDSVPTGPPPLLRHRPLVVIPPGTGEHGYLRRRHFWGLPLARLGAASLLLEGPYYGSRKPARQLASRLRQVSDLAVLGRTTVEECRGLLGWMHPSGGGEGSRLPWLAPDSLVMAGTSMGGLHSAMTAALTPFPVGLVSWLGPTSAGPVFSRGALADACEWDALAEQLPAEQVPAMPPPGDKPAETAREAARIHPVGGGIFGASSDEAGVGLNRLQQTKEKKKKKEEKKKKKEVSEREARAREKMFEFLTLTSLVHFPPPRCPEAARFTVASYDAYIPGAMETDAWQQIERIWSGSRIRCVRGGHVSATLFPPQGDGEDEYPSKPRGPLEELFPIFHGSPQRLVTEAVETLADKCRTR